jgi:hypothetical protein
MMRRVQPAGVPLRSDGLPAERVQFGWVLSGHMVYTLFRADS